MGNDNITDFNDYKRSYVPETLLTQQEANSKDALQNAFLDFLLSHSVNSLLDDVHTRLWDRFQRLMLLETISARACETLFAAGMDPGNFRIDPVAFERFQTRGIDLPTSEEARDAGEDEGWPIPPELYWNGPYYDWNDQGTLFRAATTVLRHESGEVELLIDLVKLGEDKHWLMWHDGVWEPDDFLEAVEEELRRRQIEALGPAALGYDGDWDDEEWESSIDSMLLSPSVVTALHGAGIYTIDELRGMTDEELLKIKGIGKARVAEIREALEYED